MGHIDTYIVHSQTQQRDITIVYNCNILTMDSLLSIWNEAAKKFLKQNQGIKREYKNISTQCNNCWESCNLKWWVKQKQLNFRQLDTFCRKKTTQPIIFML
jgi:hypothetical protein